MLFQPSPRLVFGIYSSKNNEFARKIRDTSLERNNP